MPYAKWAVNSQSLSHLSLFLSYHRQNNSLSHSGRLVNTILQISCFTSLKLKQTKKPVCSQKWYIVMFVLKALSSILVEYIIKGWENGGTLDLSVVIWWEVMRTATVSTPVWKRKRGRRWACFRSRAEHFYRDTLMWGGLWSLQPLHF